MRARGDVLSRGGASEENGSEQTTATKPDHFSDGHVITRLSGKRIVTQEEGKVQRRESRTDMLGDRRPCDGAAVLSLRAAPYPVAARRRAVTVLVTPLHVDEPAPAALVGVEFFFFFPAATLSCGLWRYSGVMFFLLSAISWPWHATLERMSANTAVLAQESRGALRAGAAQRRAVLAG